MNCPNCNNEVEVLERNYGALFTCPRCQAVYFINFDGFAEFSNEPYDTPVLESSDIATSSHLNEPVGESDFETPQSFPELQSESMFQEIAKDISDFGNSEVQISALHYSVEIGGLDSKEDVRKFLEIISDSRFGWDVGELIKSISNGRIKLEKLNPVQAFMLNKRIHFLEFELKWKQHALQ